MINSLDNIMYVNLNDYEKNNLSYDKALIYDKRTYFQYYCSLLRKKQLIMFTFFPSNDYNLVTIKICLFLLSFSLYFTMNGLFFFDSTMHKIFINDEAYDFLNQIPQLIYSTLISSVINTLLRLLSLTEENVLRIKQEKQLSGSIKKSKEIQNCKD